MRARIALLLLLLPTPALAEILFGLGQVNGVVGVNLEWAGERGTVYVMPGGHIAPTGWDFADEPRWVAGARYRVNRGRTATSGFFIGALAGDLGGKHQYERLGAGGEIGHQWVSQYLRWTASGGIAVLDKDDDRDLDYQPHVVLGVSVSLRR